MRRQLQRRLARAWRLRAAAIAMPAMLALPCWSQTPAAAADAAPSEAARRAAMSPFRMILQNADLVRAKPAPAPAKKVAPAAAPAPSHAPSPAVAAEREPAAPHAATAPAAAPVEAHAVTRADAATPAPEPAKPEQVSAAAPTAPTRQKPVELVALQQDPPQLSASLRREQPQGTVMVAFEVKPDGSTGDVRVVSSTNHRLNSACVDAVGGWRFKPISETRPTQVELVFRNDQ
jgi:TonB family protein